MVHRLLKGPPCNLLTADGRPQTAALEKNRRPRSAVGGQICIDRLNHKRFFQRLEFWYHSPIIYAIPLRLSLFVRFFQRTYAPE